MKISANDITGQIFAGTSWNGVFRSNDNGISWNEINNGLDGSKIWSIIFSNSSILYAGSWCFGVYKSNDNGDNWTEINNGLKNMNVYLLSDNTLDNIFAANYVALFKTTDNGQGWDNIFSPPSPEMNWIRGLAINSSNKIFVAAYGGIYLSVDTGYTWYRVDSVFSNTDFSTMAINSNDQIFVGTYGGQVFYSSNMGYFWTEIDSGLVNINLINAFAFTSNNEIFIATDAGTYKSVNLGNSWVKVDSIYAKTLEIDSNDNIYIGTYGYGIKVSTDHGSTWISINNGLPLTGFGFDGINNIIKVDNKLIAGTNSSGIYVSSDQGVNWYDFNLGLLNTNILSLTIDNSNIFIGTMGDDVWKRPISEITSIHSIDNINRNVLIYPNPVNESLILKVKDLHCNIETAEIINVEGKLIKKGFLHAPESVINISTLESGLYFIKVYTESGVIIEKFIKQ